MNIYFQELHDRIKKSQYWYRWLTAESYIGIITHFLISGAVHLHIIILKMVVADSSFNLGKPIIVTLSYFYLCILTNYTPYSTTLLYIWLVLLARVALVTISGHLDWLTSGWVVLQQDTGTDKLLKRFT